MPLPIILGISVKYKNKKARTYVVSGKATEGGAPLSGLTLSVLRGLTAKKLARIGSAKTTATGGYSLGGKLAKKATTFFQVSGSVGERDYTTTGCASPLTPFAPAGCVHATLSPWSVKSVVVKLNK